MLKERVNLEFALQAQGQIFELLKFPVPPDGTHLEWVHGTWSNCKGVKKYRQAIREISPDFTPPPSKIGSRWRKSQLDKPGWENILDMPDDIQDSSGRELTEAQFFILESTTPAGYLAFNSRNFRGLFNGESPFSYLPKHYYLNFGLFGFKDAESKDASCSFKTIVQIKPKEVIFATEDSVLGNYVREHIERVAK